MKVNQILLACNLYANYYYFLQVVRTTAKTVTVRRINANRREGTPRVNDYLTDGGYYESVEQTRRVNNGRIRLDGWTIAEPWNGVPLQEPSPFGMNCNLY